jgi:uncharacterized membrane protein YdbT with pleckstrin-like domain
MAYLDTMLTPDEQILFRGSIHPIFIFNYAAISVGIFAAAVFVNYALFLFFPISVLMMHPYWTTDVMITNKRLMYKQGLVARNTQEIYLNKIESMSIIQGIFGRIFDYGTVRVHGVGIGEMDLPQNLEDPMAFKKALDQTRV